MAGHGSYGNGVKNSPEKDKFKSTEESGQMHHIDRANAVTNLITCLPARLQLHAALSAAHQGSAGAKQPQWLPGTHSFGVGRMVCALTGGFPHDWGRLQGGAGLGRADGGRGDHPAGALRAHHQFSSITGFAGLPGVISYLFFLISSSDQKSTSAKLRQGLLSKVKPQSKDPTSGAHPIP